jgi:hypothetical protein
MSSNRRKVTLGIVGLAGVAIVALICSAITNFDTWPWQTRRPYVDGDLRIRIGATKQIVWARVLELEGADILVRGAGSNNDHHASTTKFAQVHDLDSWSFPTPPCCRCALDLTFEGEKLKHFERHCNYAPEGP